MTLGELIDEGGSMPTTEYWIFDKDDGTKYFFPTRDMIGERLRRKTILRIFRQCSAEEGIILDDFKKVVEIASEKEQS